MTGLKKLAALLLGSAGMTGLFIPGAMAQTYTTGSIQIYDQPYFSGDWQVMNQPVEFLGNVLFNDTMASVEIRGNGWLLCRDVYFEGPCLVARENIPDLKAFGLDQNISSIQPLSSSNSLPHGTIFAQDSWGNLTYYEPDWNGDLVEVYHEDNYDRYAYERYPRTGVFIQFGSYSRYPYGYGYGQNRYPVYSSHRDNHYGGYQSGRKDHDSRGGKDRVRISDWNKGRDDDHSDSRNHDRNRDGSYGNNRSGGGSSHSSDNKGSDRNHNGNNSGSNGNSNGWKPGQNYKGSSGKPAYNPPVKPKPAPELYEGKEYSTGKGAALRNAVKGNTLRPAPPQNVQTQPRPSYQPVQKPIAKPRSQGHEISGEKHRPMKGMERRERE